MVGSGDRQIGIGQVELAHPSDVDGSWRKATGGCDVTVVWSNSLAWLLP